MRYETTVGAALPIISTIKERKNCGDNIQRVEAILSALLIICSVNMTDQSDSQILSNRQRAAGYTEPDPRIDLSGLTHYGKP